jgi:hypothetical protein
VFDNGSVRMKTIDESGVSFVINGNRLKLYNKPISQMISSPKFLNKKRWKF